ncbi:hypothetical protein ACFL0K_01515 [Patescibacteria group bacterium]
MDYQNEEVQKKKRTSAILKWGLILGIVIVTNLFFAYVIQVFYPEPEYTGFCEEKQVRVIPETKESCLEVGGQWTDDKYIQRGIPRGEGVVDIPVIETEREGYCDPDYTCRQEYQDARELYERNVFVILVILGVILIIGSFFVAAYEAVSLGLSFAGILSLIIGTMRYWSAMDDYLRVIILGIALAALIYIGIKKFK